MIFSGSAIFFSIIFHPICRSFCPEQKVIITSLFQANLHVQKVWQTTPLQKFYADTFLVKVTFSIFKSIFTCIYIYTLYFVFTVYIRDKIEAEIK